jgi:hypothetical protein
MCPGFESLIRHQFLSESTAPSVSKTLPQSTPPSGLRRVLLIGALLASASFPCAARDFPKDAKAGELKGATYPFVRIDNKELRLAPGARVFDQNSRIILPTLLPAAGKILYQMENSGLVQTIWLLTAEEAGKLASRPTQ